ncbi:hypothetical protein NUH88_15915 [Nisaea acidiphila]|uniref:Uncharacterized protein n=1 Tax=Nisaea acidiphila TaxID=1862145 RepID=A0A9J7AQK8_9PROT|nr:hypothetical protein [Nisaea acidiphila]UUX48881.1 hypothetical protein NUH88_15915 [Nisaea acidiphila]
MTISHSIQKTFEGAEPDAVLFDLGAWPIVHVRFPELDEEDRVSRILNGLKCLLAQQTPFVAIWTPASHDHDDEPHEDERTSNIWIKQNRDALNTYCKGYLYITQDPELRDLLTKRIGTISGRLFDFPMAVAGSREDADRQANEFLNV